MSPIDPLPPIDTLVARNTVTLHVEGGDIFGDLTISGFASKYMQRKVAPDIAEGVRRAHALSDATVTIYYDGAECAQCAAAEQDLDEVLALERMWKRAP